MQPAIDGIRRLEGAIAEVIKTHDTRDQSKEKQKYLVNYQETELEVEKRKSVNREAQAEEYKETKKPTNLGAMVLHHKSAAGRTEESDKEVAKARCWPKNIKTQTSNHPHWRKGSNEKIGKSAEPRWAVERKKVTIREDTIIEAGGTVDVTVNLEKENKEWDFEINEQYFCDKGLICVKDLDDGMNNTMTIMNRNNHRMEILEGSTVGWLYRIDMPLEEVLV
ncbi:hypothetical protein JTB14_005736 [Gonioctena quinquepunctata]|nr:hypothetical protein JTB14_005736 [Gonioctena quinquepunctata]